MKKVLQVIKKGVVLPIYYLVVALLLTLATFIIAINLPSVQNYAVQKSATYLSRILHHPVTIQAVSISWVDELVLQEVVIKDKNDNPLIHVGGLKADFNLWSLLLEKNPRLDLVTLQQPEVSLVLFNHNNKVNINELIDALLALGKKNTNSTRGHTPQFLIDRVQLQNGKFSYFDENEDSIAKGFDHFHFTLAGVNAEISNFRISGDTFEIKVKNLTCYDVKTKLTAKRLDTFFRLTKNDMQLYRLYAEIGNSLIRNHLEFRFEDYGAFSNFNDEVVMAAHLDSSVVFSDDLKHFAPQLSALSEKWVIGCDFEGRVTDFRVTNLSLAFGKNSHLYGKVLFDGLPKLEETFVDAKLVTSKVQADDLKQYIGLTAHKILQKFGHIRFDGKFSGFFTDFVAKGTFDTQIGRLISDINIKIKDNEAHSTYKGRLKTIGLHFGKIIQQPELVQLLDMNGTIEGTGFTGKNAHFDLNASISRIGLYQYDYRNIDINANLMQRTFSGTVESRDSNATFGLNGLIDISKEENFFDFQADVKYINLQKLKLLDMPVSFSAKIDLNAIGNTIDEFQGDAAFKNIWIKNGSTSVEIDTMKVLTEQLEKERYISINSNSVELNADGNFSYSDLFADIPRLYKEYMLSLENNAEEIKQYYATTPAHNPKEYKITYSLNLKDINPIIRLFTEHIEVAPNTRFNGSFAKQSAQTEFKVTARPTKLRVGKVDFETVYINYSSTKSLHSSLVSAMAFITSQKQSIERTTRAEDLFIEALWNTHSIDFSTTVKQSGTENYADVKGVINLKNGEKEIYMPNSLFKILDTEWEIGEYGRIVWAKDKVVLNNMSLFYKDQIIEASGTLSQDPKDELECKISHFNLVLLSSLLTKNIQGEVNGDVVVSNVYNTDVKLDFDGKVQGLKIENFTIGNLSGKSDWESTENRLAVDFALERDSIKALMVNGYVYPYQKNRLDLRAKLDRFKMQSVEPFLKDYISNVEGLCEGNLSIGGTLFTPAIKGVLQVNAVIFTIKYLNTRYSFSDKIYFDTSAIHVSNLGLRDIHGNLCQLNGTITHQHYSRFSVKLTGDMKNFMVLNTGAKDNTMYYGSALANGRLSVRGPIESLFVRADLSTSRGTKIFIPINGSESYSTNEYISFVKKNKSETGDPEVTPVDLSRTEFELNLDLTRDADFQIIFDAQTGDIISGNGSGQVKLLADSQGEFNLFGNYEFDRGKYNFTFLNIINKEFFINPKSSIRWDGDPLDGQLDIKASYRQDASLKDLVTEADSTVLKNPALRKRYPVTVNLFIKGNLLAPEISYKINITDYPSSIGSYPLNAAVMAFKQSLDNNEQLLNRQVFSLLVLGRFFPANNSIGDNLAGQAAASTVSELLSNQLSSWISQVDENLVLDIDLNGFNSQALNDMRVRMSYIFPFMDERLRVTRDGGISNSQNRTTAASIAGDWTLEYMITKDGTLRLKMFTKTNTNNFVTSIGNNNPISTGFSFVHTQSFDNLNELIHRKKKEDIELPKEIIKLPLPDTISKPVVKPIGMYLKKENL